jgi:hypothetical protein
LASVLGRPVEVGEEVDLVAGGFGAVGVCATEQIVDQDLGVDLLLNVDGRGADDEVGPVLLVFAAPDELRVEIAVAALELPMLARIFVRELRIGRSKNGLLMGTAPDGRSARTGPDLCVSADSLSL